MQNAPRELLLELLKYSGFTDDTPKIKFRVIERVLYSECTYAIHAMITNGINVHEFAITADSRFKEKGLKQFLRGAVSLEFNLAQAVTFEQELHLYPKHMSNNMAWYDERYYVFPFSKYGDTIKEEFKKIAKEYGIQE